jgi:hypothetical protein
MGVSIFQFIFFRKEKRRYEADTKKREEEAKQSEAGTKQADAEADSKIFSNYKEQMDFFLEKYNEAMAEKIVLMDENFDMKQKIKEYEYRFESYDRKLSGMQKVLENSILRTKYAEDKLCVREECKERIPELGTYKHKEDENKQ